MSSYSIDDINNLSVIQLNILTFNQNAIYNNAYLVTAINNNTTINSTNLCTSIDTSDVNNIIMNFSSALSNPDQVNALVAILGNYVFVESVITYSNLLNITLSVIKVNTPVYYRIASFIYTGSDSLGSIKQIYMSSYMDTGATSYSVRINDFTNNNVIDENTFTNTSEDITVLVPINNIPVGTALIEVLAKVAGDDSNTYAYINSVTFYFA